jgi:hypothetical protein
MLDGAPRFAQQNYASAFGPGVPVVALISGNFDDSQSTGDVWTVAAYLGYSNLAPI